MKPIVLPIAPPGYRPQSADCSIEADLLQFELLRRWSPTKRLIQATSRADLIVDRDTEYSRIQLSRRQTIPISADKSVYFASPEDVIINKLIWGRGSQSEKQWRDVLSIMKTQRESLDYEYIREWAGKLELIPLYTQATIEAGVNNLSAQ
jgi:hypothetical protein